MLCLKIQNNVKIVETRHDNIRSRDNSETVGVRLGNHKSQNSSFPNQSIGPLTKFEHSLSFH